MRTRRAKRCRQCRIIKPGCICPYTPTIPTRMKFWIITSLRETYKPTNTASLIYKAVPKSKMFLWHRREPSPTLLALLRDPRYFPFVVFPRGQTHDFSEIRRQAKNAMPAAILLDGTWREASKILHHSAYLRSLPVVSIVGQRSRNPFRVQSHRQKNYLSTMETAIYLLAQLENAQSSSYLDAYFQLFTKLYQETVNFGGTVMDYEVKIEENKAQSYVGIRRRVKMEEIARHLGEILPAVYQFLTSKSIAMASPPMTLYFAHDEEKNESEILAGFFLHEPLVDCEQFATGEIPAGKVASTIHTGPYEQLKTAHAAVTSWLEKEGHEKSQLCWEIYLNDPGEIKDPMQYQTQVSQYSRS